MVDNFELIQPLLSFPNNDTYYHLQIIRRGKDHPNLPSANYMVKAYYVCSEDGLSKIKEEIISLCKLFEARAYINVAPKSLHQTTLLQLKYLPGRLFNGNMQKIWKSWQTCAGEVKSKEPAWIIDVDENDVKKLEEIKEFVCELQPKGNKVKALIPTKSGYHLITSPFRLDTFKEKYPDIDVHKNNPTVLYIP